MAKSNISHTLIFVRGLIGFIVVYNCEYLLKHFRGREDKVCCFATVKKSLNDRLILL